MVLPEANRMFESETRTPHGFDVAYHWGIDEVACVIGEVVHRTETCQNRICSRIESKLPARPVGWQASL